MFHMRCLIYVIFLHCNVGLPQINFYHSDWVSESNDDHVVNHNCLRIAKSDMQSSTILDHGIFYFCMSESPSRFHTPDNNYFSKFTFAELSQANITSEQLYLWSAPIDVAERYQFYLDQLSIPSHSLIQVDIDIFYNCSLERFGSMCQYELDYSDSEYSSVHDIIEDLHQRQPVTSSNMTCYIHLQCNRGSPHACLDWTEICDGNFDCVDGNFDEEHCWELEVNKCQDDEFQCANGQCIPQSFAAAHSIIPNCLDMTDSRPLHTLISLTLTTDKWTQYDVQCPIKSFTSSCVEHRQELLEEIMFSIEDDSIDDDCRLAFQCFLGIPKRQQSICHKLCGNMTCMTIVERACPEMFYMPSVPVLFGDMYSAFRKDDIQMLAERQFWSFYLCRKTSRSDDYLLDDKRVSFNNATCYHQIYEAIVDNDEDGDGSLWNNRYLIEAQIKFLAYKQVYNYSSTICDRPNKHQCINSVKCIPLVRLMDGLKECPRGDDENRTFINRTVVPTDHYTSHEGPWSATYTIRNYAENNVHFQTICDGVRELLPIVINGRNETDETDCEHWQCTNVHTRCNGIWNCPNGADELGCHTYSSINCSSNHHVCVSPYTNKLMCLPIEKAKDGKIDCLGATDEPMLCQYRKEEWLIPRFYCMNTNNITQCVDDKHLCNAESNCNYGDDEQFCDNDQQSKMCPGIVFGVPNIGSDVAKFLCRHMKRKNKPYVVYFLPPPIVSNILPFLPFGRQAISSYPSNISVSYLHQSFCHHGLGLRVWLNNTDDEITTTTCLCPLSFYGNYCQYQNQRVMLSIKFRALSGSWNILFAIVVSLIDDSVQRTIHSSQQFSYLPMRDCQLEFSMHLLYKTRPKNSTQHYAIQIDIYEKESLKYRGSVLFPIMFPFLPVHRLAFLVDIPRSNKMIQTCSTRRCMHGQCIRYWNKLEIDNDGFCRCNHGWSGDDCSISHVCRCSDDSLCIGVSADNRSICVCPIHKFGSRCLLKNTICQKNATSKCKNGGKCIPNDEDLHPEQEFICICQKGSIGDQCQIEDKQLIFSFEKTIVLPPAMFIHFIDVSTESGPDRKTTFITIPMKHNLITTYWSKPFHLVFIELNVHNYYLAVRPTLYNKWSITNATIGPSDRCPHIGEVLNKTIVNFHLLRRIKYYHLICQQYSLNLSCFYDDIHLCLCYDYHQKRVADCFIFNHSMVFDCSGGSECENGGQCFQDDPHCPQKSICRCPSCFHGTQCQLSTSGIGLSLDAILGYQIMPGVHLRDQSSIIHIAIVLSTIFIIAGLLNGILALVTFMNNNVREVGCGLYLLGSSITTLLTMVIFGLKFFILLFAHMSLISNRSFLNVQCISLDFLLRISLAMDQWLNACVATERAITATMKTRFSKNKSKKAAKIVIPLLIIFIVSTNIHDPFHRRLIDEVNDDDNKDQKRFWCIVTYPRYLETFNYITHTFHFFGPFIINLISVVILIRKKFHRQSNLHTNRGRLQLLREQFQQHQHLFIASITLVILAIPRLILSFVSKCMESVNDTWLYLAGYFISLIPPMITFIIFILPSKFYKKEFYKTIQRYRVSIERRLRRST